MVSIEGNGKAAVAESLTRGDEDGYVVQMVRRAYRWLGAEIRTLPAQDLLRGHLYLVRIAQVLGTSPTAQLIGGVVPIFPPEVFVVVLGVVQGAIGVGFLFRPLLPIALLLFFIHLPGTRLPLVLLPEQTFTRFPFSPTIEGQFCLKDRKSVV